MYPSSSERGYTKTPIYYVACSVRAVQPTCAQHQQMEKQEQGLLVIKEDNSVIPSDEVCQDILRQSELQDVVYVHGHHGYSAGLHQS